MFLGDKMIQEKYIELLLKRCLRIDECKSLFINYNSINKDFVEKVVDCAKQNGIEDIYLDEIDSNYIHDVLINTNLEDIENHEAFNSYMWDEYAKKNAAFLLLDSEIPHIMDDVSSESLAKSAITKSKTKPIYKEKQLNSQIPWCIAAVPNIYWANEIFENSKNPLEDFWDAITNICMLDKQNPIKEWDNLLNAQNKMLEKLNKLNIKKLHYKNNLGTDLIIELSSEALWKSASSGKWIVNMPSYEIFTTPDYRKTKGVVYSSKPLLYNGKIINDFKLTFDEGKVVEFEAKEGKDILKEIINSDEYSAYLGEAALVNYNSPISNTNKTFKSTLFDENASCHLALGNGFIECIENGDTLSKEELKKLGVNFSKNHVDFMIGTKDLIIEAETKDGMIIIMENGNLII